MEMKRIYSLMLFGLIAVNLNIFSVNKEQESIENSAQHNFLKKI